MPNKPVIFIPSNPIDIPFTSKPGGQRIESSNIDDFWKKATNLKDKRGIYIYSIRVTKGSLPWYIGQASKSFYQKIFTDDKLEKYNSALSEYKVNFKPFFQFLTPEIKKGKINYKALNEIEKELTILGFKRNSSIKNIQNTSLSKLYVIHGVTKVKIGSPSNEVKSFKKIFGL